MARPSCRHHQILSWQDSTGSSVRIVHFRHRMYCCLHSQHPVWNLCWKHYQPKRLVRLLNGPKPHQCCRRRSYGHLSPSFLLPPCNQQPMLPLPPSVGVCAGKRARRCLWSCWCSSRALIFSIDFVWLSGKNGRAVCVCVCVERFSSRAACGVFGSIYP